jgi:hypothetical protein
LSRNDRHALGCLEPSERVSFPRTGAPAQCLAGPDLLRGTRQAFSFSAKATRLIRQEISLGFKFHRAILGRGNRRLYRATHARSRQGPTGRPQTSLRSRHLARQRLGFGQFVTQEVVFAHTAPAAPEHGDLSIDPVQIDAQSLVFRCQTLG